MFTIKCDRAFDAAAAASRIVGLWLIFSVLSFLSVPVLAEDSLDSLSGLEGPIKLLEDAVGKYEILSMYCKPPDAPNKTQAASELNSLRDIANNHGGRLQGIIDELGYVLNTSAGDRYGGVDAEMKITKLRGQLARIKGRINVKIQQLADAPEKDCSPPETGGVGISGNEISMGGQVGVTPETGGGSDSGNEISMGGQDEVTPESEYQVPANPTAEPVNIPQIPEGPICPEEKQALLSAAFEAAIVAGRNARAWDSVILALYPPLQNAVVNEPENRSFWEGQIAAAKAAQKVHLAIWDDAEAALAAAKAVPTKVCAELDPAKRKLIYLGSDGEVGQAGSALDGGHLVSTPQGPAVSVPESSETEDLCGESGVDCEKEVCQEIQLPGDENSSDNESSDSASSEGGTGQGKVVEGTIKTGSHSPEETTVSAFRDVTAEDFYFGNSVTWSADPVFKIRLGYNSNFQIRLPYADDYIIAAGTGWETSTKPVPKDPAPTDPGTCGGDEGSTGGASSGGGCSGGGTTTGGSSGGGTTTGGDDDDGDDPRDTPPPVIYGEELDDSPIGILLVRDDKDWMPKWQNSTTVTARLYYLDKIGIWLPSNTHQRIITVKFAERSEEEGKSLNKDIDHEPEDSPDLYLPKAQNQHSKCSDDPSGKDYLFGECQTKEEVTQQRFKVRSEDYGSFSSMEASCADCVALKPPPGWEEGLPNYAFKANTLIKEHQVKVPKDDNDNQIADAWFFEKKKLKADEDDDRFPKGNGVRGDGISAYEEYRGFHVRNEHKRMSLVRKELFVDNRDKLPLGKFRDASELRVHDVDKKELKDRVANFNSGHANVVEQHGVILKIGIPSGVGEDEITSAAERSFGDTLTNEMGPPKNVVQVLIHPGAVSSDVLDEAGTVAHELGHSVSIRHHGEGGGSKEYKLNGSTGYNLIDKKGQRTLLVDGSSLFVDLIQYKVMCPTRSSVSIVIGDKKHNTHSGHTQCFVRYTYVADGYFQEDGSFQCRGWEPDEVLFCDSKSGGYNGGNQVAGDAARGKCKTQLQVNDG